MGEIKSVKVDNWGVFFLQKLQNFFNKTDYCDLTLQFRDNSQLKVHRLVLSACTDYFNVLEQTCEMVDDALLMPDELQADVVVPIVNFMYTGTLEFELKMYGKLLRTAKEMNMTVLLKLLEAHRRTMEGVNRSQKPPSPKPLRRRIPPTTGATSTQQPQLVQQQRRILATSNAPQQGTRVVQTKTIATNVPQQQIQFRQQIGSTSLLRTSASGASPVKAQHSTAIYNRQQIKQEAEDYDNTTPTKQQQPTSPFEQLRKGYNNNKRPATTIFVSPPAKKPNIEDVKEFAEQQRMRKQIAAEYGEDPEYEGMLDDDIHNDDDDDEATMATSSSTTAVAVQATTSSSSVVATSSNRVVQHGTTTITFKHDQNDKPPTIVVKDSSNSNINHTKIITEVLRQYPHLVKNNKNIKLKIMPNVGGQTQKIVVKREQTENISLDATGSQQQQQVTITKSPSSSQTLLKPAAPQPQQRKQPLTAKLTTPKVVTSTAPAVAAGSCTAASTITTQKRRIDSKTMHALIALGAENTTGPWLCLRCGVNGRPISIPSYRGFRRHLINTHKETIDPTLCEHCGWRSNTNRDLHFHMQVEHKVKTTLYTFPECLMCAEMFLDTSALNQHMVDSHADENKQQCIYCNKIFAKELQLYNHMKTYHKKQALADGIIDYSDEEFVGSQDEAEVETKKDTKIKILSDISLTNASSLLKFEPSSEAAALSTVASGIATSIGVSSADEEFMHTSGSETASVEPKFVNANGNEMLLTDEQRKEIMSQLNQEHEGGGGVVMLLNEPTTFTPVPAAEGNSDAGVTIDGEAKGIPTEEKEGDEEGDDQLEHDVDQATGETSATEEEFEDSQIYNELTTQKGESKKNASAALEESKESIDNLEWAENLISAHELADEVAVSHKTPSEATIAPTHEDKVKKEDDISKKLKELTGDWSDDENDDNDLDEGAIDAPNPAIATLTTTEAAKVIDKKLEDTKVEENEHKKSQIEESEQKEEKLVKSTEHIKEAKDDEDDIEVAMRSLHKEEIYKEKDEVEDDVLESTKLDDESSAALEQDEMPECKDKCEQYPNEKHEQANENKADTSEIERVEKELTDEEGDKQGAASIEGDTSKSLLDDELISEEIVPMEPQEFDKTKNVESKNVEAESKIATKTSTAVELMETDDKVTDPGEDVCTTISAVDAIEKEDEKDEPASVSNSAVTTDTVEKRAPIGTTVAITSESKADDSEPTGATSETTNSKTDDQVKSLISEWADADDDDDTDPANAEEEEL